MFNKIITNRLILRSFKESDLLNFTEYRNNPSIAKYQSWSTFSIEDAYKLYTRQKNIHFGEPDSWVQIAISTKTNPDIIIGDLAIHFLKECDKQIEIGFTLSPQAQNKGFAKEAIIAICKTLFNNYDIHCIIAITDVKNTSAIKILSKLKFRKEAHFIKNIFFKGSWGDEYLFAILKEEFIKER